MNTISVPAMPYNRTVGDQADVLHFRQACGNCFVARISGLKRGALNLQNGQSYVLTLRPVAQDCYEIEAAKKVPTARLDVSQVAIRQKLQSI